MGATVQIQAVSATVALAVLGYLVCRIRRERTEISLIDALLVGLVVMILAATAIPLVEAAVQRARVSALLEDLRVLRTQIELYKADHAGQPPLLYQGTLPQLLQATDRDGVPGPPGKKHPFGPYLRGGVPVNPITGRSIVTACESFPPAAPSGAGGWLYHQPTGQIVPDLEGFLNQ